VILQGINGVSPGNSGAGFGCGRAGFFFVKNFLKSFWKIFLAREKFLKNSVQTHCIIFFGRRSSGI
jgi:hypothetical protein